MDAVSHIDPNGQYQEGEHIYCNDIQPGGGYCLFYQSGASGSGEEVKSLLTQLKDHGCNGCGSIPTTPGENDVSKGMLTYNYVNDQKGCDDLC